MSEELEQKIVDAFKRCWPHSGNFRKALKPLLEAEAQLWKQTIERDVVIDALEMATRQRSHDFNLRTGPKAKAGCWCWNCSCRRLLDYLRPQWSHRPLPDHNEGERHIGLKIKAYLEVNNPEPKS